jgi:hypothetical protein
VARRPIPKFASDPIPEKTIRLGVAFERVAEAISRDPKIVKTLEEHDFDISSEVEKLELADHLKTQAAADLFFRAHLTYGDTIYGENLYTYIRDPKTGDILRLDPGGWTPWDRHISGFKFKPSDYCPGLPVGDYVIDPYDDLFPGPEGTILHGACRPVFIWRDEFERWFQKTFGAIKRRGRPPGSGTWEKADEPLLEAMRLLIERGSAKSPEDAARKLVHRAEGAGTPTSKQTRLAKRYRKRFPPERN